jgi:hypothetical protein
MSGICSNATTMSGNTKLTWAVDWCPSRYSWVAVAALAIYLLFFAPGNNHKHDGKCKVLPNGGQKSN